MKKVNDSNVSVVEELPSQTTPLRDIDKVQRNGDTRRDVSAADELPTLSPPLRTREDPICGVSRRDGA